MKKITPIIWVLLICFSCQKKSADKKGDLIAAAQNTDLKTVQKLIKSGVDVNSVDKYGKTALWIAVQKQDTEMVKFLLANGADVNVVAASGNINPLHRLPL